MLSGRPLVAHTLDALRASGALEEIVLVVAPEDVERARRSLLQPGRERGERVVAGGETRQASVRAGLAEVSPARDLVLVHDAARPFVTSDLVHACLEGAAAHGAAVCALPATDTVKEVGPERVVTATLDRSRLWLVQTPQAFRRALLMEAHEAAARAGVTGTDDASLVEQIGHSVHVVLGDSGNMKITHPEDVRRSEHALSECRPGAGRDMAVRTGIGYDAHAFSEDRPLVLAGVRLRDCRGLLGHSDADVVSHAVCDALLGAIGAGDIGQRFPDTDPRYAGVNSLSLVTRVSRLVREAGWEIGNVDTVVIAEEPRMAPHIPDMREALATALGTSVSRVSIKAKTTEGMGFTGRGEGIASHAIALLQRADAVLSRVDLKE